MSDDRELLELAAKAAGISLEWDGDPAKWQGMYYEGKTYHSFDPLDDDGDALRLAVKLHLLIDVDCDEVSVVLPSDTAVEYDEFTRITESLYDTDPYAATRRAIVRAAAEIGRSS